MVRDADEGLLQSDIWKEVGIGSSKCSRIMLRLEDDGLVKREKETLNGVNTYRVYPIRKSSRKSKKKSDYDCLIVDGEIAPCAGCDADCSPEQCSSIGKWIQSLIKE